MLILFVLLCLLLNVGIGYRASHRAHNTTGFLLAGRHLLFYISTTVVFATWFGSETVPGILLNQFAAHGLSGVIEDLFGAALCLVLEGLFLLIAGAGCGSEKGNKRVKHQERAC